METGCLEVVVNRKTNTLMKALHYGAIVLAVCFCLSAFLINFALLFPAIGCIVGAYFSWLETVVDYEYVYVDKEIRVATYQDGSDGAVRIRSSRRVQRQKPDCY